MAGIAYVRKRLYNPELLVDVNEVFGPSGRGLRQIDTDGRHTTMYEIHWTGATQAGEELGTAKTATKVGTVTPFQVTIVSSDVLDNRATAAGAVHSSALIGISTSSVADFTQWLIDPTTVAGNRGRPLSTVEVVAMNGTTDVLSTRWYIWLDGLYACEWGTGQDDAEGNITAESPANTNLIVLTAGQNEGEGGTWHFAPGKEVHTEHIAITPTATFAAGDGVVLSATNVSFDQALNTGPDLDVDYFAYTSRGGSISQGAGLDVLHRKTTLSSSTLWSEALIVNSIVYDLHIIQSAH